MSILALRRRQVVVVPGTVCGPPRVKEISLPCGGRCRFTWLPARYHYAFAGLRSRTYSMLSARWVQRMERAGQELMRTEWLLTRAPGRHNSEDVICAERLEDLLCWLRWHLPTHRSPSLCFKQSLSVGELIRFECMPLTWAFRW